MYRYIEDVLGLCRRHKKAAVRSEWIDLSPKVTAID